VFEDQKNVDILNMILAIFFKRILAYETSLEEQRKLVF